MDFGTRHNLKTFARKKDLDNGFLQYIEKQAAVDLYSKINDGKPYAVRITRVIGDIDISDCHSYEEFRHRKYVLQEKFVSIYFDISKAETMQVIIPECPDYSKLAMFPLAATALDEIKHRISRFLKGK